MTCLQLSAQKFQIIKSRVLAAMKVEDIYTLRLILKAVGKISLAELDLRKTQSWVKIAAWYEKNHGKDGVPVFNF